MLPRISEVNETTTNKLLYVTVSLFAVLCTVSSSKNFLTQFKFVDSAC